MNWVLALFLVLFAVLPLSNGHADPVERFEVRQYDDTAFLPYRIDVDRELRAKPESRRMGAIALLWRPRFDDTSQAYYIGFNLPHAWEDQTFSIDAMSYPPIDLIRTAAVRMTPVTAVCHPDLLPGPACLLVAGFHNDSAWLVKYDFETAAYERRFLQSGEDGTGNSHWEPGLTIALVEDYDYDGRTEVLVHVAPVRDKGTRTLYCLELATFKEEWSLPMAVKPRTGVDMYRLADTVNPGIVLLASGSRQGKVDEHYNELFKYYSVIDTAGQVQLNQIVQYSTSGGQLIATDDHTRFYLAHEFDPVDPAKVDSLIAAIESETISHGTFRLSALDRRGHLVRSITLDHAAWRIWLMPYRDSPDFHLWVYHADKRVRVYDSMLILLAESNRLDQHLGYYYGKIDIPGHTDARLFHDGIYSTEMEQLALFDFPCRPQPMTYDQAGVVRELLLEGGTRAQFVRIEQRDWYDMISVIYFRYQLYILVALSGLLVGLIVTNYYRARTRKNLLVIREQKEALEKAQEALRRAQAQLVAQEKFRQARDIAGGFAHEIRNALSPVRNALTALAKIDPDTASSEQLDRLRRLIDRSVNRAIDLTQRISEYTHLE
ncbi:hypothetical protein GF420_07035, partial [candidate division GN15 bacterium]|nr:hypothetical protein [candidate division GN15 bacterium]